MIGGHRMEEVPTTVLCGERCHLGEGPTYDPATDTAWWFDIVERRLFEARLDTGRITIHSLDVMGSALARIDAHRQLLVADDGLYVRDAADGRMTLYHQLEADNAATRSNDARVHPSGTFWIGTMGRQAEQGLGAIYALHRGELSRLYDGVTIPNAICFSPDGTIGYFADTGKNTLFRVDLDAATGLPRGAPVVLVTRRGGGGIDGAVVDAEGLIWNARWGGGCIDVYSPQGEHLRTLRVPARQSSCPAFVGQDFSRLLVTSAWQDMGDDAKRADPDHGRTFVLDVAARGRPEPDVRLATD
ncbi:sugar lactone lactonase YvrE [Bradyrhizobium sp. AZCC 2262]